VPVFAAQPAFVVDFQNLSVVAKPTSVVSAFPPPFAVVVGVAFLQTLFVLAPVHWTRNRISVQDRLVLIQEWAKRYPCRALLDVEEGQEAALHLQTRWVDSVISGALKIRT